MRKKSSAAQKNMNLMNNVILRLDTDTHNSSLRYFIKGLPVVK